MWERTGRVSPGRDSALASRVRNRQREAATQGRCSGRGKGVDRLVERAVFQAGRHSVRGAQAYVLR